MRYIEKIFLLILLLFFLTIDVSGASSPEKQNNFLNRPNLQLPFAFDSGSGSLSLYVYETSPTIRIYRLFRSGTRFWSLPKSRFVAGDFDGDGRSDAASIYDYRNGSIGIFFFNSTIRFVPVKVYKSAYKTWNPSQMLFSTVNCGKDDTSDIFAVVSPGNRKIRAYLFDSINGYKPRAVYESSTGFSAPHDLFLFSGDIDGDDRDDALLAKFFYNGDIQIYSMTESNRYRLAPATSRLKLALKKENTFLLSGKVDNDTKDDIFLICGRNSEKIQIYVFYSGNGYAPKLTYESPLKSFYFDRLRFVVGNYDSDEYSDLACEYKYASLKSNFYVFTKASNFKPARIGTVSYDHRRSRMFSENSGTGFVVRRRFGSITWHVEPRNSFRTGDIGKVIVFNTRKNSGIYLTAYDKKGRKLFSVPCSSGKQSSRSALGTFTVRRKANVLRSFNGKVYARYPVYYRKHSAMHSWPYLSRTHKLYNYEKLGKPASAGCIRTTLEASILIWQGSKPGFTRVVVKP